jgi:tetratricopeptide (TPR) repeat protein
MAGGDLEGAERSFRQALDAAHVQHAGLRAVAACRNNLGAALRARGRLEAAEAELVEALRLREELAGPDSPRVAQTLTNLADVWNRMGRVEEAEGAFRRAIDIRRSKLDTSRREVAHLLGHLGDLCEKAGRDEDAVRAWREARELDAARTGEHALDLVPWYDRMCRAARRAGDAGGALAAARRSLELRERHLPSLHTDRATGMVQLALVLEDAGEVSGARDLLGAAQDVLEGQLALLGEADRAAREKIEPRLAAVRARLAALRDQG